MKIFASVTSFDLLSVTITGEVGRTVIALPIRRRQAMSLNLTAEMAKAEIDERVARAADYRRSNEVPAARSREEAFASVTVRTSYPDDHERLERLAARDG